MSDTKTYYWKYPDNSGFGIIITSETPSFPLGSVLIDESEYYQLEQAMIEQSLKDMIRAGYEAQVALYGRYLGLIQFGLPDELARSLSGYYGPADGPVMPPELIEPELPQGEPESDA